MFFFTKTDGGVWLNPSALDGDERGTVSIVYSGSGSASRVVRQAGIRNRQESQTGGGRRAGRIVRQAGIRNRQESQTGGDSATGGRDDERNTGDGGKGLLGK